MQKNQTPAWDVKGNTAITEEQRRMLNTLCGDLSSQLAWHSNKLSKDDWRHMLSGTVLGWRMLPGIDTGNGSPGLIYLGGSSKDLSKSQASDAITMAIQIGDHPDEQGLDCKPVRWGRTALIGMGFNPRDFE
jgi:hypothetical protein